MMAMKRRFFIGLLIIALAGCNYPKSHVYDKLVAVDSLLRNEQVDSALYLLDRVNLSDCDEECMAYYHLLLPQALYKDYQFIESDSMIRIAVNYYREKEDYYKLAQALLYDGNILYDAGKASEAMKMMKEAEAVVINVNDDILRHNIFFQIASINSYSNEKQLALDYIRKALECSIRSGKKNHLAYDYQNCSVYFYNLGDIDSCRYYIDRCISLIKNIPIEQAADRARIWKSMGFAYYGIDKDNSLFWLEKAIELSPLADAYSALARLYLDSKDTVRAKLMLEECITAEGSLLVKSEGILLLSQIEQQQGNHKRAVELSQRAYMLKDSLTRQQQEDNIKAQQIAFDFKMEREQAASVRRWLWTGLAITILIGVVAVAVVLYRWDKTRRRLAEEQRQVEQLQAEEQQVNKELSKTKRTVERLKRARQEQDKAMSSRQREWEKHKRAIERGHRLFMELNNGGSIVKWSSDDFKDFRTYYDSVNRAFAETIAQNYEPLSPNLYMLAALGHAGKNDDDIMATMGLTLKALRTTRTRLSKKEKGV